MIVEGTLFKPIELLILDFQMPNKNGIQACLEIRQFYAARQSKMPYIAIKAPRIVFLTAFTTP